MSRRVAALVVACALALLAGAPSAHAVSARGRVVVERDVTFARTSAGTPLQLDVWYAQGTRNRPVVVLLHGGAWRTGNRRDWEQRDWPRWFVRHGWVVVAVDYRLACDVPSSGDVHPDRVCGRTMLNGLVDVRRAIGWVRTRIRARGGRPGAITLMGGSAGGHLALLAGSDGIDGVTSVVAISPIVDLPWFGSHPDAHLAGAVTGAVGCTWVACPAQWRALSPLHRVHLGQLPPRTYVFTARGDIRSPFARSVEFDHALTRHRVDAVLRTPSWFRSRCHGPWQCDGVRVMGTTWNLRIDIARWLLDLPLRPAPEPNDSARASETSFR